MARCQTHDVLVEGFKTFKNNPAAAVVFGGIYWDQLFAGFLKLNIHSTNQK